ncbi:MAG: ATPase [Firmicutes bacterium GWF2_51_9]|nr:MAG: ATPase [Firmicutes bacterium GWF2_51_9]OGS59518.1 MAG: ATPase [Firmicutes bacterium GWE2_51_13]HAM63075.1 ATPase [Erysipelotrichaceae bacterium]HBZ41144.1 ATPase [Erysipelotrichaceae bacterium]
MKIAVLSGKGGTGKTLVSVNLASVIANSVYLDCDVEEPNGRLFFKPEHPIEEDVNVLIPIVDQERCDGCRACVEFCRFNALAIIKGKVKVYEEICHSCGGCTLVCPQGAIREIPKSIGRIERGVSHGVDVRTGILNVGNESGVPIIKKLLESVDDDQRNVIIDCPPGSSCVVMESIKSADVCVLVAEPTIFGAHNLAMVYELACVFEKPVFAVLNKTLAGENPSKTFCIEKNIEIAIDIPFDEELGRVNSNAGIIVEVDENHRELFMDLYDRIQKGVGHEAATHS